MLVINKFLGKIVPGSLLGAMPLLADGWHMVTHWAAFMSTIYHIILHVNIPKILPTPLAQVKWECLVVLPMRLLKVRSLTLHAHCNQ